ncbi:hypothetical protein [Streptomyces sp. NPDC046925]|uniref:hypothetical protein n=1 Tax=Streptomyces sp. NPDC046925 TaxID=3155375 RepID=UPI0033E42006
MLLKWTGLVALTAFVAAVVSLAWGIAGLMDGPPCPNSRGCPAVPDAGRRMAATFIGGFALAPGFMYAVRKEDWHPLVGLPIGGVIGAAVMLSTGQTLSFWLVAALLIAATSGTAIGLRIAIRSLTVQPAPVD